jgi:hypothetical protein
MTGKTHSTLITVHELSSALLFFALIIKLINRPDDGGSKDLWNVGKLLPDYTVLQPRRQQSSTDTVARITLYKITRIVFVLSVYFLWSFWHLRSSLRFGNHLLRYQTIYTTDIQTVLVYAAQTSNDIQCYPIAFSLYAFLYKKDFSGLALSLSLRHIQRTCGGHYCRIDLEALCPFT